MTAEVVFQKIDNYFFTLSKQKHFIRFAEDARHQEMWVTGQLTSLFDTLIDDGTLSNWEPQFPLSKVLAEQIEGKASREKIDFRIITHHSSDPIYLELKAVPWHSGEKSIFNFALFNSPSLPDDVRKLAKIKKGQCFCVVFLYPSPDRGDWEQELNKFIEKQKPIRVNEYGLATGQQSEHLYIAKLEVHI